MTTDYTVIAEQYKQCKEHPWRSRIETYSITSGMLKGQKSLMLPVVKASIHANFGNAVRMKSWALISPRP